MRTKEFEEIGVPRHYPRMMCKEGLLVQVGHGVYRAASSNGGSSPLVTITEA
ncbi:type IV toxin-antitoxin system AbiEi family antitoxin domain-containing protein [Sphingopyxis sp. Root1497]|uniref:type IV toxin-antitoxin system AbiEi family antitoxin domain-containing protein n=1 Tax=Sphingopyxis sp. Root1497 TaxID=1736474 RepID=UPI001F2C3A2D|nr:type IV toxin-antitoxin system AbiEi family antitoxin domain-containing protein [Sphingopyxis sp. Root1497]